MTYFDDKPFVLQIHHDGEWWVSDWFATIAEALIIAEKKRSLWRIIHHQSGEVMSKDTHTHLYTTTSPDPDEVFDIFRFERVLRNASFMALHCEVIVLDIAVMTYATISQESEGDEREMAAAKAELYDALRSAVSIEIQKRKQPQYVALCEN